MSETPTGIDLIAIERKRQIEVEGWSPEHDDGHSLREIALAAACYAACAAGERIYKRRDNSTVLFSDPWPWDYEWDKRPAGMPSSGERLAMLIKAGALIAAEIDRLQRAKEGK